MSTTGREAATAEQAQVPGITRIDLQRQDLSAAGREVIQNRVEISDEAPAIRHKHPGEEIIYVLQGTLEYQIDGMPAKTYNAGEALIVPAETVHAVRNAGEGNGAELRPTLSRGASPSSFWQRTERQLMRRGERRARTVRRSRPIRTAHL